MCGRFLLESEVEDLIARYNAEYSIDNCKYGEIFPSQNILTVVKTENKAKLIPMKWGLPMNNTKKLIINARAETVDKKPMFKSSFLKNRCIVPANAFFEWKTEKGRKIKHQISQVDNNIFSMGAIYNHEGFVILTVNATEKMKSIHNRMPLILTKEEENIWLNNTTHFSTLKSLISAPRSVDFHIKPETEEKEYTLFDFMP